MKRFIKLTYNDAKYLDRYSSWVYIEEDTREAIFRLDSIVKVCTKPTSLPFYKTNSETIDRTLKTIDVFFVKTNIAYGRGINGIGFDSFYLDKKEYKKLIKVLEEDNN